MKIVLVKNAEEEAGFLCRMAGKGLLLSVIAE